MNSISNVRYANAAVGQQATILQDIRQKAKNIAIYQRDISAIQPELARVMTGEVQLKTSGTISELRAALKDYFDTNLVDYQGLLRDILQQIDTFQQVSQADSFRLLLATVRTNMCRKFHTDINSLRLLCTYVGPGTLWLPDEVVNQSAFLKRGNHEKVVLDEAHIQQAGTGDVLLLKGALYPGSKAIVHRSPTIEDQNESRLLLRIDTNDSLRL